VIAFLQILNWVMRTAAPAIALIFLRVAMEPYLPTGHWHDFITGIFICVLWPASVWSLRAVTMIEPVDLYTLWWW
jgi:hypothetical protein